MLSSKSKVDKYVTSLLQKQRTESERKRVGYKVAEIYYKINELLLASRYLDSFLEVNTDFYRAFNLRGKIFEDQNNAPKALDCYKRSLELNDQQKDILVKVCELHLKMNIDRDRLRYWYEKLENVSPKHEVLMRLKEKICSTGDSQENMKELEDLYTTELKKRPHDVNAHVKLFQLLVKHGRVNEAYTLATQEEATGTHDTNIEWYRCVLDIYEAYKQESGQELNGSFHTHLLWAQNQLILLSLEQAKVIDATEILKNFDETLKHTTKLKHSTAQWNVFVQEMQAQLYFMSGVLLLKKVKDCRGDWKEASSLAAACFLYSYSIHEPNMKAAWSVQASEDEQKSYCRWYRMACYRASQSGHMLRVLSAGSDREWTNIIQEELCNEEGKQSLFEKLFHHHLVHASEDRSFLYNNTNFTTFNPRHPILEDLQKLDEVVEAVRPENLNHTLWRALQYKNWRGSIQPNYHTQLFSSLPYGNTKLGEAQPATLCRLDIQTFLYAAVLDSSSRSQAVLPEPGVPQMLPLAISDPLGTPEQNKWWTAVYQLTHNINKEQQSESQRILQYGLEKLRLVGQHGLDSDTLIQLARTFAQRLMESQSRSDHVESMSDIVDEQNALQARVEHFWDGAVKTLAKLSSKKNITLPKPLLFTNRDTILSVEDIDKLQEESRYNLALVAIEAEDYQRAIGELCQVSWPEATFETGQCYKKLAAMTAGRSFEAMDTDQRSQQKALLEKAKECFQNVMDQLAAEQRNPCYGKALDEYQEIMNMLENFEFVDQTDASFYAGSFHQEDSISMTPVKSNIRLPQISRLSGSFAMSTPRSKSFAADPSSGPSSSRYGSPRGTPRRPPQASPERIDIQLQSFQRCQRDLLDEFKKNRKLTQKLEDRVDDLESTAPKANDYKLLVDQNQSLLREVKELKEDLHVRGTRLSTLREDFQAQQDTMRKQMESLAEQRIEVKSLKMFLDNQTIAQAKIEAQLRAELKAQEEASAKKLSDLETKVLEAQAQLMAQAQMAMHPQLQAQAQMMTPMYPAQVRPPRGVVPGYPGGMSAAYRLNEYECPAYGVPGSYVGPHYPVGAGAQYGMQQPSHGPQRTSKQHLAEDFRSVAEDFEEEENGYYPLDNDAVPEESQTSRQQAPGLDRNASRNVPESQLVNQWPNGNGVQVEGRAQSTVHYSPQRPVIGPHSPFLGMSPTHAHMFQGYSPTGHPMPGPGFFSIQDPARAGVPPQGFMAQPTLSPAQQLAMSAAGVTPQGVSPAAVSGANLFKLPANSASTPVATSYPLTMPPMSTPVSGSKYGGGTALDTTTPKDTVSPGVLHRSPRKASEAESEGDTAADDSYTGPEFKPLVSLPEVDTITGEENETALFNNRAKLFRFIEGQWKERGVGHIKILRDQQSNVRILMRRDQVLKVCANHRIKSDMDIEYKSGDDSKKVLTWRALDHTDSEVRMEQFCCRFKTPEIAAEFKGAFETAKKLSNETKPSQAGPKKSEELPTDGEGSRIPVMISPQKAISFGNPDTAKSGFTFGMNTTPVSQPSAADMLKAIATKASEGNAGKSTPDKSQTNVGGFTFMSPPVIKNVEDAPSKTGDKSVAEVPENQAETKPFAGFSFAKPAFGSIGTFGMPKISDNKISSTEQAGTTTFGTSSMASPLSFGRLASSGSPQPTFSDKKSDAPKAFGGTGSVGSAFAGSGKPIFKTKSPLKITEDEDHVEEYEPDVDFKPIVSLPETVDLQTGEEDEEKLFGHRAKLYKNDPDSKQWKERGTGEIKIMRNTKLGTYRVLMRREQVHKTCANHHITKDMKLAPLQTSETAWCWFAQDFSEEEIKAEQFAVRFKHKEQSQRFKEVFEECVEKAGEEKSKSDKASAVKPLEKEQKPQTLADQFKAKAGDWDCEACYVRNKAGTKKCVACETLKPGETADEPEVSSTTAPAPMKFGTEGGFVFDGAAQGVQGTFGKVSDGTVTSSQPALGGFKFDGFGATPTAPTTGGFKFGGLSGANLPAVSSTTGGFGSISFGTPIKKEGKDATISAGDSEKNPDSTSDTKPTFGFGSSGFSFSGVTPVKSEKPAAPKTPTSPGEYGDYYVNQEGEDDHIYFAPVVKLPDAVELTTGEEDEDLLYCHKAKLFRFTNNEWKERGIGNVKILRNKTSDKARMLMRREHVLKICMNHSLTKDLALNPMPHAKGKAWVWHAVDFAEDDQVHEQFAIRFATEEVALDFKNHFETARDDPKSLPTIEHVEDKAAEKKSRRRSDSYRKKSESKDPEKEEKVETKTTFSTFSFKSPEVGKPSPSATPKPVHSGFNFGSMAQFGSNMPSMFTADPPTLFGSGTSIPSVFGGSPSASDETRSKDGGGLLARLLSEPSKEEPLNLSASAASSDDVIVMGEEPVSDEWIQEARKWLLPDAFYLYETRPPCKGCVGCLSEDFDFATIGSKPKISVPQKEKQTTKIPDEPKVAVQDTIKKTEADSTSSIFGGANSSSFGDFSALASKTEGFAFGQKSDKPFSFAGTGKSVFGVKSPSKGLNRSGNADADEDEVSESPDVHFEPIVQLPEVVDPTTGEEGHEKIFSHRAKLYRYDNNQWKERAVGDMKILKNTETGRCRLIMRREQVLKVACNHYLTADMTLQPLQTSETAWCWFAVDHAENTPKEEQFALRFKTKEMAALFKEKFDECKQEIVASKGTEIAQVKSEPEEKSSNSSAVVGSPGASTSGDEYEDQENSTDEVAVLFSKRATLSALNADGQPQTVGMGELQVIYDEDVCGARVQMMSDNEGQMFCNHIICRRYQLRSFEDKKMCEWSAKNFSTDEPIKRTFRAQFSSKNAVGEFAQTFDQGLTWANESEIDEVSEGASITGEITDPHIAGSLQ